MSEPGKKLLQFFFHRIAAVIGTDRNRLVLLRSGSWHTPDYFDATIVDDIRGERRESRVLCDAQDRTTFKAADVIFSNYYFGGLIASDCWG
jgi:hypothetical protein